MPGFYRAATVENPPNGARKLQRGAAGLSATTLLFDGAAGGRVNAPAGEN
jgi:hypothetical protein